MHHHHPDDELSYPEVGATADHDLPEGYKHVRIREPICSDTHLWDQLKEALRTWKLQEQAGMDPVADGPVEVGRIVRMTPAKVKFVAAVCKVIYVVDEPTRYGFAYGTTHEHPEKGEESFILELTRDGVWLNLTVFSHPHTALAKASGPLGRRVQRAVTRSYFLAMRAIADELKGPEEVPDGTEGNEGQDGFMNTP